MKTGTCYIVGAGSNYGLSFAPRSNDYVIAVDGGLRYLEQSGITADLVIGNFDTWHCVPEHHNAITLNAQKDDTDMLAAIREGIGKGYNIFHIYCGMGGRIEHMTANMQILAFLSQN